MDIAILIPSCDKYSDLWNPFFTLLFRYWLDCPYPVYLGSNQLTYDDPRVISIKTGYDRDWSSNLTTMLNKIPASYVLILLEDYLINRRVDTQKIIALAHYMEKRQAACLRLFPCPGPDIQCADNPEVGEISKGAAYRVSLQAALWNKSILQRLLLAGESPWMFELHASRRSDEVEAPFLSVMRDSLKSPPISYFCTAVIQGKWVRQAVRFCKTEGIAVDLKARPVEASHGWLGWIGSQMRYRARLIGKSLIKKLLALSNYHKTRHALIPVVERFSIKPDRIIHKGAFAGKGCYYKTALLNTLIKLKPKICLEIGTYYGGTTTVFEQYFEKYRPDGILITADIMKYTSVSSPRVRQVLVYPHTLDVIHYHNVSWQAMLPNAQYWCNDSVRANVEILLRELQDIGADAFDFCFIDGDHTEISFLRDIQIAETLSHPPHYLLLDDVKEELHECSLVYNHQLVHQYHHYEFDDWPIFVGVSLIWKDEIPHHQHRLP